jgi:hypothetical protein
LRDVYKSLAGRTNDLLVGEVIRANEVQVRFSAEHALDVTLVRSVT